MGWCTQLFFIFLPSANEVWGKVIFSEACVKNSVHGGGGGGCGVVSQHALQVVSQHTLQVSRPTPKGEVEGSDLGGGLQVHTRGVSRPTPGGGLSQHALRQTPQQMATAVGGYASYWNAFLLLRKVDLLSTCVLL